MLKGSLCTVSFSFCRMSPFLKKNFADSCLCMSRSASRYAHRQENRSLEAYTSKAAASRGQASKTTVIWASRNVHGPSKLDSGFMAPASCRPTGFGTGLDGSSHFPKETRLLHECPGPTQLWERVLQGHTAKEKRQATQATGWPAPALASPSAPGPGGQPAGQGRERLPLFRPAGLRAARPRGGALLRACMPGY